MVFFVIIMLTPSLC